MDRNFQRALSLVLQHEGLRFCAGAAFHDISCLHL